MSVLCPLCERDTIDTEVHLGVGVASCYACGWRGTTADLLMPPDEELARWENEGGAPCVESSID